MKAKRIDLSQDETRILLDMATKRFVKDIHHGTVDDKLANLIRKLSKALRSFEATKGE